MHEVAPLIYDLAIMLGLAALVVLLFQRIHQPVVLGYLVAGIIIGPYTPPYTLISDVPNIKILSALGVIFLMFSLGLEFSFKKLTKVGLTASVTGLVEVILMSFTGYAAGMLMGWTHYNCLFLGAALAISSTTIIVKAIDELKLKTQHFAHIVFGVLVVEDLLAIMMLVGLSTVVTTNNIFSYDMLAAIVKLVMVVGTWFLVGYFFVPTIFRSIAGYINEESLTIISVALCLLMVILAARFHYSTALGAFIMGSILAETMLVDNIHNLIRPIRDIFAAVFFISVGMLIDPNIIIQEWPAVLFISFIVIAGKLLFTGAGAFLTGQSMATSLRVGFSMAQVGEFSFIIVALGMTLDVTNERLYSLIVAVSGITTFTTPYLIRLSGYVSKNINRWLPKNIAFALKRYTAWIETAKVSSKSDPMVVVVWVRVIVNGVIIAAIFTIADQVVFPYIPMLAAETWKANSLSLFLALIIASPFIWGMLFSYKKLENKHNPYLHPAAILIWFATFSEIAILGIIEFNSWLTILIFLLVAIIFIGFLYRRLEMAYDWFEKNLVENINRDEEKKK